MHADYGSESLARTPTKGGTSGSAGVLDNSLCESLPLEKELHFAVDDALIHHFLHHELLGLLRSLLRVLLAPLPLPHGIHWRRGRGWRGLAGHGQTDAASFLLLAQFKQRKEIKKKKRKRQKKKKTQKTLRAPCCSQQCRLATRANTSLRCTLPAASASGAGVSQRRLITT